MNRELVDKFGKLEREIAEEKGPLTLFVILLREELGSLASTSSGPATSGTGFLTDRWDLIASAPWIYLDKQANFKYFAKKLQSHLGKDSLLSISRIVLLRPDNPVVEAFNQAFNVEHGVLELADTNVFGLEIKRAYIITSQRPKGQPKDEERVKAGSK